MTNPSSTILIVGTPDNTVTTAVAASFPHATLHVVDPESLRRLPPGAALIVSDGSHARIARATGYTESIAILAAPADQDERDAFLEQGSAFVDPDSDSRTFANALADAIRLSADGAPQSVAPQTARRRRLLAAGEIACSLQHALNNPLTALMTEVQMLQIEAPHPDTRASAERMLELVRRMADMIRSLDSVRDQPVRI